VTKSVFTDKHEQFRFMLVQARRKAGLTQVQLANLLSRPQSFVSKVERGERRLDVIEFLEFAETMGFEPCAFLKALRKPRLMPRYNEPGARPHG
jgi:transcriptional regulator with XRE-family HTH domain